MPWLFVFLLLINSLVCFFIFVVQLLRCQHSNFRLTFTAVPDNLKEMAKNSKPSIDISNSGNSWTIKTTVSDKVKDSTFNIGEEFDTQALTGQPLKVHCIFFG